MLIWKAPSFEPIWIEENPVPESTRCDYGHLIWVGQECMQCALEIRAAKILNRGFEEWKMNQAFEELKYYCKQCTARKFEGWAFCPFCGDNQHYHGGVNGQRIDGQGVVRMAKQTVNECSMAEAGSIQGQISSEEEHFNAAIKVVRETFDKVKRVRKSRDQAERELKASLVKNEELQRDLAVARNQRPEPIRISQVFGKRPDSDLHEALPLITIHQDAGQGCVITVGLRK